MLVSIVTPAYDERENLPVLYERLRRALDQSAVAWEWIIVDDHSSDGTFEQVTRLADADPRVRGIRLSRNFGSHAARTCGFHHALGDCVIGMASDLQDPPELVPDLLARWREGAQVVLAVRAGRPGERKRDLMLSRAFRWLFRVVARVDENASAGVGYCLLDRRAVDALNEFRERNVNTLALIAWMGFRQARIDYDQQPRLHGRSGWTLGKKVKLATDSFIGFSHVPLLLVSLTGLLLLVAGGAAGAVAILGNGAGGPGWAGLVAVACIIAGVQALLLGLVSEYLWRALDETRRRPRYLVEQTIGGPPSS